MEPAPTRRVVRDDLPGGRGLHHGEETAKQGYYPRLYGPRATGPPVPAWQQGLCGPSAVLLFLQPHSMWRREGQYSAYPLREAFRTAPQPIARCIGGAYDDGR